MSETITWIDAETEKPDADLLVLLARTGHDICIGYFDDEGGAQWRADNGAVIDRITHWAEMPIGQI